MLEMKGDVLLPESESSGSAEWEVAGREEIVGWIRELVEVEEIEGSAILTALHMREPRLEMSEMQAALERYVQSIKAKTMEKMSGKYGEFAHIAEEVCSQGLSDTTRTALTELYSSLSNLNSHARQKRQEIEYETQALRAAEKISRENQAVQGFGLLLDELEAGLILNNNDKKQHAAKDKNIERLAHAALSLKAQLEGAVDFISDGALVTQLHEYAQRVDAAEGATRLAVEAAFETLCCHSSNQDEQEEEAQREACLRAGAALGMGARLEELFALKVMRPFLKASFTPGRLDGADRGSANGLPWILSAALDFIKDRALIAIRACDRVMASPGIAVLSVDLLCRGVWSPVAHALLSLDSLFQLGSRQKVRKCYNIVFQSFLEPLSDLVHDSTEALRRLEASDDTRKLREEWNLPVYAELVKTEIISSLPMQSADELLRTLHLIWDQCLLLPVASHFLELTFFIIDDFMAWAENSFKSNDTTSSTQHFARLAVDFAQLDSIIKFEFPERIVSAINSCSRLRSRQSSLAKIAPGFNAVISPRADGIRRQALNLLAISLADEAAAGFRLVKSVTARYHLTNAPAPTLPSEYLAKHAFPPLDKFDEIWRSILPFSDQRQKLTFYTSIHNRISQAYASQVTAVLEHANKFQATLARRHHRKSVIAPTLDLASDAIKIKQQLLFDLDSAIHRLDAFADLESANDSPLSILRNELKEAIPSASDNGDDISTSSTNATNGVSSVYDGYQVPHEEVKEEVVASSSSIVAEVSPHSAPTIPSQNPPPAEEQSRSDGSQNEEEQSGPPVF
mmetsp:Transcript_7941/g.12075  ORF Transcript_7941/g.12075 Transcript_7941/m.12075 type:complete len:798 (-) Transcript_7941:88-2481(-)